METSTDKIFAASREWEAKIRALDPVHGTDAFKEQLGTVFFAGWRACEARVNETLIQRLQTWAKNDPHGAQIFAMLEAVASEEQEKNG